MMYERLIEFVAALVVAAKRKADPDWSMVPAIREPAPAELQGFTMPLELRLFGHSNALTQG